VVNATDLVKIGDITSQNGIAIIKSDRPSQLPPIDLHLVLHITGFSPSTGLCRVTDPLSACERFLLPLDSMGRPRYLHHGAESWVLQQILFPENGPRKFQDIEVGTGLSTTIISNQAFSRLADVADEHAASL